MPEATENRSNRLPAALLPYQQLWIADNAQVKVYLKSRRIGISWTEAADDTLLAASQNGMDVLYIGYSREMALEFIEDCGSWARHYQKAAEKIEEFVFNDEDKDILAYRISFASGYKIIALSSRPRSLRGKQGKIVIDEAAFHDDLPGLLKAAIAHLMWGGRVVIISTHNGEENPFNELISEIRAGKKKFSLHMTTLDDALAAGFYRRICLRTGTEYSKEAEIKWREDLIDDYGDDAAEELFCIAARGSGIYFPRALIESCMDAAIPVIRWSPKDDFVELPEAIRKAETDKWFSDNLDLLLKLLPKNQPVYFGFDCGRTGDLSVIWPLVEEPLLKYRAPFVIELRNTPFSTQEKILWDLINKLPRFGGGALDSRGIGAHLAETTMQKYGSWRIHQVMLTTETYREYMPIYKAAYEDRMISVPRDGDVLDDHRLVRMEKGIAKVPDDKRGKGRDGKQRHGDSAVAGMLAIYAIVNDEGGPVEYATVTKGRRAEFGQGAY